MIPFFGNLGKCLSRMGFGSDGHQWPTSAFQKFVPNV
jgi:hypothetical protein